jgi:steroid 5-alpha reductase family enzyme
MTAALALTLGISACAVLGLMLATYAAGTLLGRHNVADIAWGGGFALVALVSLATSGGHGRDERRALLAAATVIWGLRLAWYIFRRSRGAGEDPRYAALLGRAKGSRAWSALRVVYLPQGALVWLISLPVQAGMFAARPLVPLQAAGVLAWLCGLFFEAVGDWQLERFKADPANRGKVMDRGLWAWTRHPNYFGDSCVWTGLWILALGSPLGLITVFSPVLMTVLLLRFSGKALLEKRMLRSKGAAYAAYLESTSGFFPLPPRRAR